jgi:hypothetical protein
MKHIAPAFAKGYGWQSRAEAEGTPENSPPWRGQGWVKLRLKDLKKEERNRSKTEDRRQMEWEN